jgi:hypothetical protein
MDFKKMLRSKTFWASATAIIGAAGGYATGQIAPDVALQTAFGGLIAIFLRDGIQKSGPVDK